MQRLYVSKYHYTRDLQNSRYPNIKAMDIKLFRKQLDFFEQNFQVVTMERVIDALNGKVRLPDNALLLTFDDGYIDNYTFAFPLLHEKGMQGSFFIPGKIIENNVLLDVNKIHFILASTSVSKLKKDLKVFINTEYAGYSGLKGYEELYEKYAHENRFDDGDTIFCKRILQTVLPEELRNEITSILFKKYVEISEEVFARELYMNKEQIRLMKKSGMFIGIHGYDHYWLSTLSREMMKKDIDRALESMDEFIDKKAWVMNYPYGDRNDDVIDIVRGRGCVMGFTVEERIVELEKDDRYIFPRLDCNDFPPISERWRNL